MPENCGPYWAKVNRLKNKISSLKDRIGDLKSIPPSPSLNERLTNLESKKKKLDRDLLIAQDIAGQCEARKWIDDRYKDKDNDRDKKSEDE